MVGFVEGVDRGQSTLFPALLDDYVAEDNPVRAVDVFVDGLDLDKLGFVGVQPLDTGRPGYHPGMMLKLYIYGYLNRVPSSRRLERECQRNIEMIWLTGQLAPDFKTIADFRKDNGKAIREVCREFVALCRKLDLLGGGERRHRRIEVQGGQCAGQELHRGQDEAAPRTDRREHRPLSLAARDRRSAWRCGARGESRTFEEQDREAQGRDRPAQRDQRGDDEERGQADLAHRS